MSDVNNNPLQPKSLRNSEIHKHSKESPKILNESESRPVIENLDESPQAFLGRSQVKKVSIDELNLDSDLAKNIKRDVMTFKGNSRLVKKSDVLFENKLSECIDNGDCESYKQALEQQIEFVEEFKRS